MLHELAKAVRATAEKKCLNDVAAVAGANAHQVGGDHYRKHGATGEQHWDRVARLKLDYFQGQITKYVERWRDKGGIQDLRKAAHFLQKYIELEEQKEAARRLAEESAARLQRKLDEATALQAGPDLIHSIVRLGPGIGRTGCGCPLLGAACSPDAEVVTCPACRNLLHAKVTPAPNVQPLTNEDIAELSKGEGV